MGNTCKGSKEDTIGTSGIKEKELRKVFKEVDINGDNHIDESELKIVMQKMGRNLSPSELSAVFKAADTNGNGTIDFEEFVAVAEGSFSQSLQSIFKEMDVDGDGQITKTELKAGLAKMGVPMDDSKVEALFDQCDKDKSGEINFDEFVKVTCQCRKKKK